jgi:hypothetical protein
MGISIANFSKYINKRPSHPITENFLSRFYEAWGEELMAIDEKQGPDQPAHPAVYSVRPPAREAAKRHFEKDHKDDIDDLRKNIDALQGNLDKAMESLFNLIRNNERLVENHQKLIEAHLSFLSRLEGKTNEGSPEKSE